MVSMISTRWSSRLATSGYLEPHQVVPPGSGVAEELTGTLLVAEQEDALARSCARRQELDAQAGLPCAGRSVDEHDRVVEVATAGELVDDGVAAADAARGHLLAVLDDGLRQHHHALAREHGEGEVALAVHRAAHLQHLDGAPSHLALVDVPEQDDAIRHELLDPEAGERLTGVIRRLDGEDDGEPHPAK
jgi:hypothetical protein